MPNGTVNSTASDKAASGEERIFVNAAALADGVAEWMCTLAQASKHDFTVCLSGGSTPRLLYERLAAVPVVSRFPWNRVHWFWGDERFVPHDDSNSNYRMAYQALFSRVPVSCERIHPIPTMGLPPAQSAADYEATLQRYYGAEKLDLRRPIFDITLLGIGEDGHTASLFPGDPALHEDRRWVVAVVDATGKTRITLTYPTLNSSRNLAFVVTGATKKSILVQIRARDRMLPAARIRPIGRLYWFMDQAAAPD